MSTELTPKRLRAAADILDTLSEYDIHTRFWSSKAVRKEADRLEQEQAATSAQGDLLRRERINRVIAASKAGKTAPEIAASEGISARTVQRIRRRAGIGQPTVIRPFTDDELATAARMLDDGASRGEVARTLHRSEHAIARRFPGRCWTRAQTAELSSIRMRYRGVL